MIELVMQIFFLGFMVYSIVGVVTMLRALVGFHRYDEIERRRFFDALAWGMLSILLFNGIQLAASFVFPAGWSGFVSPGGFNTGGLISNHPLHFDSFLFDCAIIGICYNRIR